jgi:phage terminase large subunit
MLVALHHSRIDVAYLAEEVAAMSVYYGKCMVVPEVNNSGLAVVKYLLDYGVPVYQRRRVSDVSHQMEKFYGWNTDRNTRKTVIDHLAKEILDENLDIPSEDVIKELKTFVINKKGKPEAAQGFHDDHVLASAITVFNIDSASRMKMPRRSVVNPRRLKNNPTYLCPDGWSRNPRKVNTIV